MTVRRRELIALIGTAALARAGASFAQQTGTVRKIGALFSQAAGDPEGRARAAAFREGLKGLGWVDGQNVKIDFRWASGSHESHRRMAEVSRVAGMTHADGQPALLFRNEPWCDGAVWSLNSTRRALPAGWIALALCAAGTLLVAVAPFGGGTPIMANYVPVIDAPLFLAGLGVFGAGLAVLVARGLFASPLVGVRLDGGKRGPAGEP